MFKAYYQFLIYTKNLDICGMGKKRVDEISRLLLNEIALNHFKKKPLTVTKAMDLTFIAGPATIHRKIKDLHDAGLVELRYVGLNRRTKYLIPTDVTNFYFGKMSEAMMAASTV